jgi:nucleotide-binding universal stress UspA family protein
MLATRLHLERILCPSDFSDFSVRAVEYAAALAKRFEARLSVLHVLRSVVAATGGPYFPATGEMRDRAACELRSFVEPAIQAGAIVATELREGDVWREIQARAAELPADLLVMGTHGRSGFEQLLLGSVTEKVLRRASCPVLTVCHDAERTWREPALFRRILCATDFSESSPLTVAFALSLAAEQQAQLTLLHVLDGLQLYRAAPEFDPWRRQLEETARRQLEAAVAAAARDWCTVQHRVTVGRAHSEIVGVAREQDADLIVMGTHGHGSIARAFFGSTSHHVVREASCPVLTVRPRQPSPLAHAELAQAVTAFQP